MGYYVKKGEALPETDYIVYTKDGRHAMGCLNDEGDWIYCNSGDFMDYCGTSEIKDVIAVYEFPTMSQNEIESFGG